MFNSNHQNDNSCGQPLWVCIPINHWKQFSFSRSCFVKRVALLIFLSLFSITNNLSAESCPEIGNYSNITGSGPDLQIELIRIEPQPGVSNKPTAVDVRIKNAGTEPVMGTFTTVLCVDGKIANSKEWKPIPGEVDAFSAGSTVPFYSYQNLSPGTHTLRWAVDSQESVAETDEQNNTLELTEKWIALSQAPDIVIKKIFARSPQVQSDGKVTVDPIAAFLHAEKESEIVVTIANTGQSDITEDVTLRVTQPFDNNQETQVAYFTLKGLSAGATKDLSFIANKPDAGTVEKYTAYVDVGNIVIEANEENNMINQSFKVRAANMIVKDLVVSPIQVGLGESVFIRFDVHNKGDGDVPIDTRIRVSPGKNETTLVPVYLKVPPLAPGQTVKLSHNYKPVTFTNYEVALEVNPPEERRWPEQIIGGGGKTAFSSFKVVTIGPKIKQFYSTVIDDNNARLDWEVLCNPRCGVWLKHLYYASDAVKVALKGSREVSRDRNIHDGTWRLTASRVSESVKKEVKVPRYAGSQGAQPQNKIFYFKCTNPDFWANPCDVIMFNAPNEETAKIKAQALCLNYQVTQITKEQYENPDTCK